jgi:hypothetical protein
MFGAVAAHYVDAAAPVGYDATVLASSPLRYYKFQETSGTVAADSSGNGQNGTINGSPTLTGNGITFGNNNSQNVDVPLTGLPAGDQVYSSEFIVLPNSNSGGHDVVDWGTYANASAATGCGQNGSAYWNYWNGSNVTTATGIITSGHADHVVMTYDQSNVRIYVNGALKVTAARSAHANSLTLCRIGVSLGGTNAYWGTIKRVAIYGSVLSGTDVTNRYNAAVSEGLV